MSNPLHTFGLALGLAEEDAENAGLDFDTAYKLFEENFNDENDNNTGGVYNLNLGGDTGDHSTQNKSERHAHDLFASQPQTPDLGYTNGHTVNTVNENIVNGNTVSDGYPDTPSFVHVHTPKLLSTASSIEPLLVTPKHAPLSEKETRSLQQSRFDETGLLALESPDFFKKHLRFSPSVNAGGHVAMNVGDNRYLAPGSSMVPGDNSTISNQIDRMVSHMFASPYGDASSSLSITQNGNKSMLISQNGKNDLSLFQNGNSNISISQNGNHESEHANYQFDLLSAKETDTIVQFLNQFDRNISAIPSITSSHVGESRVIAADIAKSDALSTNTGLILEQNHNNNHHHDNSTVLTNQNDGNPVSLSKKRKYSYDELQEKVDLMEKKLTRHKDRHKISERKRRAAINDSFIDLTDLIRYPRNPQFGEAKGRVTKYKLLDYIIEDITAVTENNIALEDIINRNGKQQDFQNWLLKKEPKPDTKEWFIKD